MADYKKRVEDLRTKLQDRKLEKAKLEERKSSLEKDQEKILSQLKEKGINSEEEAKAKVTELEADLTTKIEKAEQSLS